MHRIRPGRGSSATRAVISLVIGVPFVLFWIKGAGKAGAPPFFLLFGFILLMALLIGAGKKLLAAGEDAAEWNQNNALPQLVSEARIVSKRVEVSGGERSTYTRYFATFELTDGARLEMELDGSEYGQVAENDTGRLHYQGTRYLGFQRVDAAEAPPAETPGPAPASLVCDYCGSAMPAGSIKCAGCGWTWHPATQSRVVT
jgi:hypothetical protein